MKIIKTIVLGLSLLTFSACSSGSSSNGINEALVGSYSCTKGRKTGSLQLSESGKFKYVSFENFMGYEGEWEANDGDDRLGSFNTKNKLSNGNYQTQSHNYQKKQNRSLVIFFDENIFNSTTTCKFSNKSTSI